MSIISNEHQSGSPFDRPEESEPEKLYTDTDGNQVTLDTLCRREPAWAANIIRTLRARVAEFEMSDTEADRILTMSEEELDAEIRAVGIDPAELDKTAGHVAKWATECSKLRARVGEFEAATKPPMTLENVQLVLRAESAEARVKELEARSARRFPIMGGPSIPWEMIAPCERQAQSNHQQSLERLAERGGLDPTEALAVLESRRWHRMDPAFALASLAEAVRRWEDRPLQARITDLESQLAAAREEHGRVREHGEQLYLTGLAFDNAVAGHVSPEMQRELNIREPIRALRHALTEWLRITGRW